MIPKELVELLGFLVYTDPRAKGINLTLPHEPSEEHEDGNGSEVDEIEDCEGTHEITRFH